MMPSLAEIVFNCPLCAGPLIAWESDAGRETDCPHCHQLITLPSSKLERVDKSTYCEPHGLRRILKEVRDTEWEVIRRKLQRSRGRIADLEKELQAARAQGALSAAAAAGHDAPSPQDLFTLRSEMEAATARLAEMGKMLASTRQQHEIAMDRLREQLEVIREEVEPLREENAEMLLQLTDLRAELEREKRAHAHVLQELEGRKVHRAGRRSMGEGTSASAIAG